MAAPGDDKSWRRRVYGLEGTKAKDLRATLEKDREARRQAELRALVDTKAQDLRDTLEKERQAASKKRFADLKAQGEHRHLELLQAFEEARAADAKRQLEQTEILEAQARRRRLDGGRS